MFLARSASTQPVTRNAAITVIIVLITSLLPLHVVVIIRSCIAHVVTVLIIIIDVANIVAAIRDLNICVLIS